MCWLCFFFFQAEDGIRDLVRSRGLGDVYKRQDVCKKLALTFTRELLEKLPEIRSKLSGDIQAAYSCLLYTSDAADDLLCVDLGGRRIIKKKNSKDTNVTS